MSYATVSDRIKVFCEYKKLSQVDLRKILNIRNRSQISQWFNAGETVPDRYVVKIIKYFKDINARWLITGEGEMIDGKKEVIQEMKEQPGEYKSAGECRECKLKDEILRTQMKTINRLEEINEDQRAEIKRLKGVESDNQQIAV